jgi:putative phosphoribosyl transferase
MDRFKDRRDAGRRLAGALEVYRDTDAIVLGLPRGGVPVAFEVARALGLVLDVLVVRKLGAPGQPELAMGAVAQGGVRVLNDAVVQEFDVSPEELARVTREKQAEVDERVRRFRGERPLPALAGKTVLLVDDGVATGSTILAAAQAVRSHGPANLVIAVPVLSTRALERLRGAADEIVYLLCRDDFFAVGQWYEDFRQTTDEDVVRFLAAARREAST